MKNVGKNTVRYYLELIKKICYHFVMERDELVEFYKKTMKEDVKLSKLGALKEQKKVLKQRLKAVENYKQLVESQLESVLDQIDYLTIYY